MRHPEAIERLIESFMRFPGIGKKTAERYAYFVVHQFDLEDVHQFMDSLNRVKTEILPCQQCGFLTDQDICPICQDITRDQSKILVVEDSKDVIVLEKAKTYQGLYHVLNGVIAPALGIGPDDINLKSLIERLKNEHHKEVILAMNLSDEGETTALYLDRLLKNTDLLVTRIAYGLPAGGNISYADELTLMKALEGRKKY